MNDKRERKREGEFVVRMLIIFQNERLIFFHKIIYSIYYTFKEIHISSILMIEKYAIVNTWMLLFNHVDRHETRVMVLRKSNNDLPYRCAKDVSQVITTLL